MLLLKFNFITYTFWLLCHLSEKWCFMITVIDFIDHDNDEITEQFQCCYFELHTSVYNSLKIDHIDFTLNCYFGNDRWWAKVCLLFSESFVAVTVKIVSQTVSENCFAVCVLNMFYLSKSSSVSTFTLTLISDFFKKQINHWSCNAESSTSFKRIHHSSSKKSFSSEVQLSQTSQMFENELDQQLSTTLDKDSDADNCVMSPIRSSSSESSEHLLWSCCKQKQ